MRKIHILGLALFAVFAFGSYLTSAAFAEEVPQWLINGEPILLGESFDVDILPHDVTEEGNLILLEDMEAPGTPDILCEVEKALGWLLPNGEDLQTTGECNPANLEDMKNTCEKAAPLTVAPVNLPWRTQLLEPETGVFHDDLLEGTGGNPGWQVKCRVLFVTVTDTCTTAAGGATVNNVADGLLLVTFLPLVEALCTLNNTEKGLVEGSLYIHALTPDGVLLPLAASLAPEQP
jgi:hypothetical protein